MSSMDTHIIHNHNQIIKTFKCFLFLLNNFTQNKNDMCFFSFLVLTEDDFKQLVLPTPQNTISLPTFILLCMLTTFCILLTFLAD